MSWWVSIEDNEGETIYLDEKQDLVGGTMVKGGTTECTLNITYNYSGHYFKHLHAGEGLRWLHGRPIASTIKILEETIKKIRADNIKFEDLDKNKVSADDYWAPTSVNAATALENLLCLALQAEGGTWRVN